MNNILRLFLFAFVSFNIIFAQNENYEIVITDVLKNGNSISPDELKENLITTDDILIIKFDIIGNNAEALPKTFKVTLDGTPFNLISNTDKSTEIKKLTAGKHLLRITGSINGKEVSPKYLDINVVTATNNNQSKDYLTIYLKYIIGLVILFLIVFVAIVLVKNSKKEKTDNTKAEKILVTNTNSNQNSNNNNNNNKQNNNINVNEAYEKLKAKYKELEAENSFQRSQIRELKEKIEDLEQANLKLIEKKEKLAESKQQLEELQAQKEELFAIAIHDIKNPAAAIRSYLELIKSYDLNAVEQTEIMESMIRSSEHIVELAHEMTTVIAQSKPEPMLNLQMSSLKNIIDSVYTQNKGYALNKQINLLNKSSIDIPEINIDPSKIEEVIDNLVNNALKYSPPNTSVVIHTYFTKDKIIVEVTDSGVGLSEDDVKKAFQKGVRLTPKPTGNETSSGLGLWIVKKIIEEHGGRVFVKSKLGKGSTFGFELPIEK